MSDLSEYRLKQARKEWCFPCWNGSHAKCLGAKKCPCKHRQPSAPEACPKCGVVCNDKEGWCGCSVCPGCKRDDMVSRTEADKEGA